MPPTIAVISFPGSNCEVESLRSVREAGMEAVFFRWNDDRAKLEGVDGYFLPGGFSYEDRGRSGMVAARDALLQFLHEEAAKGKSIIGNCNGAQILVESGLVPLDRGLRMSLAHNVVGGRRIGFLSQWVWITRSCARDRCATSDWDGVMHVPMAHGEGRFTTRDPDVVAELRRNDQIAFSYCDAHGVPSDAATPNGSMLAIAGICNPAGNVVALMPHPERTAQGAPYFSAWRRWLERAASTPVTRHGHSATPSADLPVTLPEARPRPVELFVDTVITNNEERTVEAAARRIIPHLRLKQLRYVPVDDPAEYLSHIRHFNPHKEIAYIRRGGSLFRWNPVTSAAEPADGSLLCGIVLLRRDEPHEGEKDAGVCYVVRNVSEQQLCSSELLAVFGNPHASTLLRLR